MNYVDSYMSNATNTVIHLRMVAHNLSLCDEMVVPPSTLSKSKHHIFHELFLNFNFLIWFSIFFVNFNDVLLDLQLNKQKVGWLWYNKEIKIDMKISQKIIYHIT
jgi:hypothetical protein